MEYRFLDTNHDFFIFYTSGYTKIGTGETLPTMIRIPIIKSTHINGSNHHFLFLNRYLKKSLM